MTDHSIIKASFADFRLIKGRKQAQLVFELPIELADTALQTLGGLPRSDIERWFAIARLDLSPAKQKAPDAPKKHFDEMPLPQQVALRCNDKEFQNMMECEGPEDTASAVRAYCNVESRSYIMSGTEAAARWQQLSDRFWFYQRGE